MLRDVRKDIEYFKNYITYQNQRIEKFKMVADSFPDVQVEKRNKCLRMIANFQKDLFSAKYSLGVSKEELKRTFEGYIRNLHIIKTDEYAEYIDALAIGILLDFNLYQIKDILEDEHLKDGLVDVMINPNDLKSETLKFPAYYQIFFDFILGRKSLVELSNYMSEVWYGTNKEFAWYESDKSTENIYSGYWCWLAGACLKLKHESVDFKIPYIPMELL